jgi:hypothetical protein
VKSEEIEEPVARRVATETLEALIAANAPSRNSSEVTWALWGAIVLGLDLSPAAAESESVSRIEDDFVALLALHAGLDGRFGAETLNTSNPETVIAEEDALKGPHWLLAYEAGVRGWLAEGPDATDDSFFGNLAHQDVRFYDDGATWDPFSGPSGPLPGSPLGPDIYP